MFYAFIMYAIWLISHAYCVLCVLPWVGGVDVYTMWAVHCLSALCIPFSQVASATATIHGLSRGLLGL